MKSIPPEQMRVLREHADACSSPLLLRDFVHDCSILRTWKGDATLIRLTVSPELQAVASCLLRLCVKFGGVIKYGPPPRGPLERATAQLLQQRVTPA